MNRHAVWAIARKDLATVVRNRGVRTPLLVAPVVILVVMPLVLVAGGNLLAGGDQASLDQLASAPFLHTAVVDAQLGTTIPDGARWGVFVLEVFLAPLYLLVPLIVATVIAADSFAGERERGTLEALLHTPTSDRELLAGKFFAAIVPALAVSWVGFAVYGVLANLLMLPVLGHAFFPSPTWLLLAFWVTPAISTLGLGVMVIASSRVDSLQAAHQIGSMVVLPIVLLLIVQITGTMLFEPLLVTVMGAAIWALSLLLLAVGSGSLRRQALTVRL